MKTAVQGTFSWKNFAAQAAAIIDPEHPLYMEHRWGRRRPCRARVCVSVGGSPAGSGQLRNISMSGAFIETTVPLALYSQIVVVLVYEDGSRHAAEFTATVVRREPDGVGIEWLETASMPACRMLGCSAECALDVSEAT